MVLDHHEWIPIRQAVAEVVAVYAKHCEPASVIDEAIYAIQARLQLGWMLSRAATHTLQYTNMSDLDNPLTTYEEPEDGTISCGFWHWLEHAETVTREDWISGEFAFYNEQVPVNENYSISMFGCAVDVLVTRSGLPAIDDLCRVSFRGHPTQPIEATSGKRDARPPLPGSKLRAWWGSLTEGEQAKPHLELEHMCRSAHPAHFISRQRIRDLDLGRKRGPKPLSQKVTA
jgi:hypothetical protein